MSATPPPDVNLERTQDDPAITHIKAMTARIEDLEKSLTMGTETLEQHAAERVRGTKSVSELIASQQISLDIAREVLASDLTTKDLSSVKIRPRDGSSAAELLAAHHKACDDYRTACMMLPGMKQLGFMALEEVPNPMRRSMFDQYIPGLRKNVEQTGIMASKALGLKAFDVDTAFDWIPPDWSQTFVYYTLQSRRLVDEMFPLNLASISETIPIEQLMVGNFHRINYKPAEYGETPNSMTPGTGKVVFTAKGIDAKVLIGELSAESSIIAAIPESQKQLADKDTIGMEDLLVNGDVDGSILGDYDAALPGSLRRLINGLRAYCKAHGLSISCQDYGLPRTGYRNEMYRGSFGKLHYTLTENYASDKANLIWLLANQVDGTIQYGLNFEQQQVAYAVGATLARAITGDSDTPLFGIRSVLTPAMPCNYDINGVDTGASTGGFTGFFIMRPRSWAFAKFGPTRMYYQFDIESAQHQIVMRKYIDAGPLRPGESTVAHMYACPQVGGIQVVEG